MQSGNPKQEERDANIQYCKALLLGRENWKANYEGENDWTQLVQKQHNEL